MRKIATGIGDFKNFIDNNCFYVDKTQFIDIAFQDKVSVFTRPSRFGKTLNMSMLYYFFSNKEKDNSYLFDGLKITNNTEIIKHQNKYPVIFISFKTLTKNTFDKQIEIFKDILSDVIAKELELLSSEKLHNQLKDRIDALYYRKCSINDLMQGLLIISQALEIYYHQKVILLIDEYDVPLQTAYQHGYYDEISNFFSGAFTSALKTNDSLMKGVMTGCLKMPNESIFTGLNNFKVYSIFDEASADSFGFTQDEVNNLLAYYHLNEHLDIIKDWYGGYVFGDKDIYNSCNIMNYLSELLDNTNIEPRSYWANTNANSIVYDYIKNSDRQMKDELEMLIQGSSVVKYIKPNFTYEDTEDINNVYTFLLLTGYLKVNKYLGNDEYELIIPNKEVSMIYKNHFLDYFRAYIKDKRKDFVVYLTSEDVDKANELLDEILFEFVSFDDNYDSFYYELFLDLLSGFEVKSNHEPGSGRFNITILSNNCDFHEFIVLECQKSVHPRYIKQDSENACKQIKDNKYINGLHHVTCSNIIGYGISFYQKTCCITKIS